MLYYAAIHLGLHCLQSTFLGVTCIQSISHVNDTWILDNGTKITFPMDCRFSFFLIQISEINPPGCHINYLQTV